MENKGRFLLRGPGLYAAATVCAAAVIAGGCLLLRERPAEPLSAHPDTQAVSPAEPLPDDYAPAAESVPLEVPEEAAEPAPEEVSLPASPMPEIPVDDTPVAVQAPRVAVSPLEGEVVAAFSVDTLAYDETMGDWRTHAGVDIAAEAGASVLAAGAGTVLSVTDDALMGTTVILRHSDGYESVYASLQASPPVEEGESVSAGQIIGAVGDTAAAEAALGAHLHFAVTRDGQPVDPDEFLAG